uniref:Transcription initiation factor TFIID subunit 10 n=1 Tax=Oryza nivara TaxID=4536 RepID=A0A0E0IJX4_ORYNI
MGSNSAGGGGGGAMVPGGMGGGGPMGAAAAGGGGDGRHDDEAVLTEFLSSLMDYTPTLPPLLGFVSDAVVVVVVVVVRQIPDELVEHYLGRSGFHCPDLRLTRLVAVATQKFISDIASDSLQYDRRLVLTMDDLSKALQEHGVNLKHPEYFADSPSAGMAPAAREE